MWGRRTATWLDELRPKPDAVIIYGGAAVFASHVIRWARGNGAYAIVDAVEWYDATHQPGGRFGPFAMTNEIAMRSVLPRAGNVVAISSFLAEHFRASGCHVMTVPPTTDVMNLPARLEHGGGPLRLAYAGVPGRKDLLGNVIAAVARVHAQRPGAGPRLDVAGVTGEEIWATPGLGDLGPEATASWLTPHGRIDRSAATNLIRSADFMPLLRPNARYAHAGFPTKVVESLSLGTPVLGNLTSDLGSYLVDGRNAVLCPDHSVAAVVDALTRALALSTSELSDMRHAARFTAEQSFDYRVHVESVKAFLEDLQPLR